MLDLDVTQTIKLFLITVRYQSQRIKKAQGRLRAQGVFKGLQGCRGRRLMLGGGGKRGRRSQERREQSKEQIHFDDGRGFLLQQEKKVSCWSLARDFFVRT